MSEDTVRIITYEPVVPPSQQNSSQGSKSPDIVIPVPTFPTEKPSQDASQSTDEVIGKFKVQEVPKEALKVGMNQLMDVVEQLMTQMERRTETTDIKIETLNIPKNRVPSYSTIRRVMMGIDFDEFLEVFNNWAIAF